MACYASRWALASISQQCYLASMADQAVARLWVFSGRSGLRRPQQPRLAVQSRCILLMTIPCGMASVRAPSTYSHPLMFSAPLCGKPTGFARPTFPLPHRTRHFCGYRSPAYEHHGYHFCFGRRRRLSSCYWGPAVTNHA